MRRFFRLSEEEKKKTERDNRFDSPTPTRTTLQPLLPLRSRVGPKRVIIKKDLKTNVSMAEAAKRAEGERVKGYEVYSKWTLK